MHVLGTAGHVDHGKSSLVAALTGTHPDRLKEEREREMTIDLGFSWFTLPSGQEVGIVDVPGHRDFIENMLAGVGGIDAVLLVIAADEGIMPQTREHLAILDLLQVPSGLVVITKTDLVTDPGWLDLVAADVRSFLHGTILEAAPILPVSSRTREGLEDLTQAISDLLARQPSRPDLKKPRLPIDRVFSMPGFGTVVTGTLSEGCLATGDEVELMPSGTRGRIRGLQTHRQKEEIARPGSRTAVNLSGLDAALVRRGEVVTHPGQVRSTQRMDVHFRLLPDVSAHLRHHTEVKVFLGTSETVADVRLLGMEILEPGGNAWLQLELRHPVVALRSDRFILRRPSPGETLGGGVVIEPHPKRRHKRFDKDVIASLETLARGKPSEVLLQAALLLGPSVLKDVINRSRLPSGEAESALAELVENGLVLRLDEYILAADHYTALKTTLQTTLLEFHRAVPLRRGMPREELKSRLKLQPRVFNLILPALVKESLVIEGDNWVALPDHKVQFSPAQQQKVNALLARFSAAPVSPPSIKECIADVGDDVFRTLLDSSELVAVSEDVVFRKKEFDAMTSQIRKALSQNGQITLAEVRDLLGTSRKYVQALLEHLDSIGMTVREGDFRKLRT